MVAVEVEPRREVESALANCDQSNMPQFGLSPVNEEWMRNGECDELLWL